MHALHAWRIRPWYTLLLSGRLQEAALGRRLLYSALKKTLNVLVQRVY